ncbi:MAG: epoxyqueuosine reductase QueH [Candidatus Cloacimonetes bacterium]|nr:epoxyqueuosine reductase QueH [Candidatus Cloacimonadota bacterium]
MEGKRILVHVCCAPCFVAPYQHLKEEGFSVHGFWFNHNIHPYTEYRKRLETVQEFAAAENIPLIVKDEYLLEKFLRNATFRESDRCRMCYYDRLKYAAIVAAKGKFDYFTTTLLYSKFQNHELIRQVGEALGREYKIPFLYRDFREYWKEGIALSKERNMYRQQYCGCIYSERDRYLGKK